jgi:hypothetical protein
MITVLGVGKTCLLLRYANDSFSPTFITTIGIDFKIKNIQLDGKRIKLQVYRIYSSLYIETIFHLSIFIDMGHSWPRTLPNYYHILFPWSAGDIIGVRRDR